MSLIRKRLINGGLENLFGVKGGIFGMAKKVHSVSLKGILDMNNVEVHEITKDGEFVYDLKKILHEFHDKQISLVIKEENELPTKDMEE